MMLDIIKKNQKAKLKRYLQDRDLECLREIKSKTDKMIKKIFKR